MVDDYSDSSIYRIYNRNKPSDFYIGSSRCIRERMRCHYEGCNNENTARYNSKLYTHIRDNGGWGYWVIDEIYNFSCNSEAELREKEQEFINRLKPTLNINRAAKTDKLVDIELCKLENYKPGRTLCW